MKATHLCMIEKIELVLLLSTYFMPLIILLGWIIGGVDYFTFSNSSVSPFLSVLSVLTFSALGNFAPFFEIGGAAYLDNRKEIIWLIPALAISFIMMTFCSAKAFIDLILTISKENEWYHTTHNGIDKTGKNKFTSGKVPSNGND